MKVLIDLTALADNFSGIERYAAELSIRLIKDPNISWILVFKREIHPLFREACLASNIKTKVLRPCSKFLFYQVRLFRAIRKQGADINLFLAFPPAILLKKKNAIVAIHDMVCWDCPETMKRLGKWYFRLSMLSYIKKCKEIITISNFSKERIVDRFPSVKNKISIVYCGVDDKFKLANIEVGREAIVREKYKLPKRFILSLSTIEPRKNLPLLLKAYRNLYRADNNCPDLVLVGRQGWGSTHLLDGMEDVETKIHCTGFVDDLDLPIIYKIAECFIFTSKYEGFGIPPLEALAAGTRVISSDAASLPEVLGDAAIYFKNNDERALMLAIQHCMRQCDNIEMVYKRIEHTNFFSWDIETKKLRQVIYGNET